MNTNKVFEVKYMLYKSVDEMLAPRTLSRLAGTRITRAAEKVNGNHNGLAGGKLSTVQTDNGRFVLKRMSLTDDFIMAASSDTRCRSVTLWQYNLLDELLPEIEHEIVACANDGEGWALLMNDLSGHVFTNEVKPTPAQTLELLDAMARVHATFWNDDRLTAPELGICDTRQLLEMSSLASALCFEQGTNSPLPEWIIRGWAKLADLLPADLYDPMRELMDDPRPLLDAVEQYQKTLIHGDFRAENLAYTDRSVLLDWQEAAYTLPTADLVWFLRDESFSPEYGRFEAEVYYRQRLEWHLGARFANEEWQAMLDLGYGIDALRAAGFYGMFVILNVDNLQYRQHDEWFVRFHAHKVQKALRWL